MKTLLIEPHYLPNLEYCILLSQCDEIIFETKQHFIKQTFQNRTYILTSNGVLRLSIPVKFKNHTLLDEVTIDYSEFWHKKHLRAIQNAYSHSPFFDFIYDLLIEIYESKPIFLVELNLKFIQLALKFLNLKRNIKFTQSFEKSYNDDVLDFRNLISAKKKNNESDIYTSFPYRQNFEIAFESNLSILDLLMNHGNESAFILSKSTKMTFF